MLDDFIRNRISDYFEGHELVEYLRLKTDEIIDAFEAEIEDALEDIVELMDYGTNDQR